MAKITSILRLNNPPLFTANNAVSSVLATQPAALITDNTFLNAAGLGSFQARDNVLLKSMQLQMPYMFTLAAGKQITAGEEFINLDFLTMTSNTTVNIPGLGGGQTWLMQDCPKIELNTFIPWVNVPLVNNENRQILARDIELNVSQEYAPATLNGIDLYINVFLTVEHTLELV